MMPHFQILPDERIINAHTFVMRFRKVQTPKFVSNKKKTSSRHSKSSHKIYIDLHKGREAENKLKDQSSVHKKIIAIKGQNSLRKIK